MRREEGGGGGAGNRTHKSHPITRLANVSNHSKGTNFDLTTPNLVNPLLLTFLLISFPGDFSYQNLQWWLASEGRETQQRSRCPDLNSLQTYVRRVGEQVKRRRGCYSVNVCLCNGESTRYLGQVTEPGSWYRGRWVVLDTLQRHRAQGTRHYNWNKTI